MSGNAKTGFGVKFGIETATPGTFDDVAELLSVGDVELSKGTIDATAHDNTSGFRDHIAEALTDMSDFSGEAHFNNDADVISIRGLLIAGTKKKVKITFPTSPACSVTQDVYFTKLAIKGGDMGGAMTYSFSAKPTGAPTWA